jgi:hypothetical protein
MLSVVETAFLFKNLQSCNVFVLLSGFMEVQEALGTQWVVSENAVTYCTDELGLLLQHALYSLAGGDSVPYPRFVEGL